ncbi:CobW family GTP-binding protein [Polycyclovorans algicola]|uniref:CobW family GTP-binding protein n=1 Tax=Polycyclovorans algicola TaxID=616992 RepID=UPI0004A6CC9C|nr:GTP-binding protein [Polycyclovorans algicola]
MNDAPADTRIPVAVLTGFLGAGKTTLLNFLLRHPAMQGTAVVVNEFGDVGLDHHLIEAAVHDVELIEGGCLCCTVRGALGDALIKLLDRSGKDGWPPIKRIILETTGVAEPGPILRELAASPELSGRVRSDGTTTLVDAAVGADTLARQRIARTQVAAADQLLISKADLVEPPALDALQSQLRALNPEAPIDILNKGAAKPQQLFGTAQRGATQTAPLLTWLTEAKPVRFTPLTDDTPAPDLDGIDSFSVVLDAPLPEWRFYGWLSFLRGLSGPDLLRVKGFVNLEGQLGPVLIHGVQGVFHEPESRDAWPTDDHRTRLVFITQGWGKETVRSTLGYLTGEADDEAST